MVECPGCGKADKLLISARTITYWNNSQRFRIVCIRCNWQGPEEETAEKAVKEWNKRKGSEKCLVGLPLD